MPLPNKPNGLSAEDILKMSLKRQDDLLKLGKEQLDALKKLGVSFGGKSASSASTPKPATYGLLPDTVSGDDRTYAVEAPIQLPEPPATPAKKEDTLDDVFKNLLAHVVQIHHLVDGINDKPGGSAAAPKEEKLKDVLPATLADFFKEGAKKVSSIPGDASKSLAQTDVGENLAKAAGAGSAALGGLATGLQTAMSPITALAGAASGAAGAFQDVASKVTGFVEAFNPSLVEQFGQAMRDLTATFGLALQPVVEGLTAISREVGSLLLPVMKQLQPVIASATKAIMAAVSPMLEAFTKVVSSFAPFLNDLVEIGKALQPLIEAFASLYQLFYASLKPVLATLIGFLKIGAKQFEVFGKLLTTLTPAIEVLAAVMNGIAATITAAIETFIQSLGLGELDSLFDDLRATMEEFAAKIALAIATLAKLAGFDSFVKGFIDGLKRPERESNVGIAAAQGVNYQGFEAFSKAMSAAASRATGAGTGDSQKKTSADWLEKIQDKLAAIESGNFVQELAKIPTQLAMIANGVSAITAVIIKPAAAYTDVRDNFLVPLLNARENLSGSATITRSVGGLIS